MELYKNDTIAAISTAMTGSGIGIIRISGEKSVSIAEKIFHPGKKERNYRNRLRIRHIME